MNPRLRSWVLNESHIQQIKLERAKLILDSIHKLTEDRDRIGLVFDPMRTDHRWKTELLERYWIDNGVPIVSTRTIVHQED